MRTLCSAEIELLGINVEQSYQQTEHVGRERLSCNQGVCTRPVNVPYRLWTVTHSTEILLKTWSSTCVCV